MKIPYFAIRDRSATARGLDDILNLILIGFALGEAVVLCIGGAPRWRGEQFTIARQVPGSPYSWAAALALFAILFAIGIAWSSRPGRPLGPRGCLIVIGAVLCAAWCFAYGLTIFWSGQIYPEEVSHSGPWQWLCFSVLFMAVVGQHLEFKTVEK